jgi:HK97 family phage prohead protease
MPLEDINTTPPKQAQQNARRGLELRKEWGRGGTEIGVARARNISNGDSLSEDTIKRMASFNRHRQNYKPDKKENDGGPTAGTIAWLLWGGTEGVDWAIRKSKEFDNERKKNMEKDNLNFIIKSLDIGGDADMTFEAYANISNVEDRYNDIIKTGAWAGVISKANESGDYPKLLYQHDHKKIVGVITNMQEDVNGLLIKGKFIDTTLGRDVYTEVKTGAINQMSVGFSIKDQEITEEDKRIIKEIERLYEVSFVTFPANEGSKVISVKSEEGKINVRRLEKILKDHGLSNTESKAIISGGIKNIKKIEQNEAEYKSILKDMEKAINSLCS